MPRAVSPRFTTAVAAFMIGASRTRHLSGPHRDTRPANGASTPR
ncbi:hypothetical protein MYA_5049 [Burkholderia sp. KJ006]|nr:hypothetical protein MYA_5049 [Burkholderia sp. KJ006]